VVRTYAEHDLLAYHELLVRLDAAQVELDVLFNTTLPRLGRWPLGGLDSRVGGAGRCCHHRCRRCCCCCWRCGFMLIITLVLSIVLLVILLLVLLLLIGYRCSGVSRRELRERRRWLQAQWLSPRGLRRVRESQERRRRARTC